MNKQKPTVAFRLDDEIIEAIQRLADEKGISKSELVRQILKGYLDNQ